VESSGHVLFSDVFALSIKFIKITVSGGVKS
jgi:hypothetical protein